jgi:outer membrane lipoprotein carrier protein
MKKQITLLFLLLASFNLQAKQSTMDILVEAFANIKTYQAGFIQTLYDSREKQLQKSSGLVYIKKPGKFRWDYKKPHQQLIVSNNLELWVFDVDMDQATVRKVDDVLASAPAVLLGSDKPIYESFDLKDMGQREGLAWVQLIPKNKDSDFNTIYVAMDKGEVRVMELRDNFEQVTQIKFNNAVINKDINDAQFEFIPPKGVDVLGR